MPTRTAETSSSPKTGAWPSSTGGWLASLPGRCATFWPTSSPPSPPPTRKRWCAWSTSWRSARDRLDEAKLEKEVGFVLRKYQNKFGKSEPVGEIVLELLYVFGLNGITLARDYSLLGQGDRLDRVSRAWTWTRASTSAPSPAPTLKSSPTNAGTRSACSIAQLVGPEEPLRPPA